MKRNYNQPAVLVARIALESMVLAGSPAPTGNNLPVSNLETADQW